MANLTTNEKKLTVLDVAQTVKAIVPRSFEKTFDGLNETMIATAFKVCLEGLNYEQVSQGIRLVRDNGFCPDPAMFRKWCLGITGFGTEQQRTHDTYKGKNAALANIVKWRINSKTVITNAEKEAYDRSYVLFSGIECSSNYERKEYQAYAAFKENYDAVVNEFSEKGISQSDYNNPEAIEHDDNPLKEKIKKEEPLTEEQQQEYKQAAQAALSKLKSMMKIPSRGAA